MEVVMSRTMKKFVEGMGRKLPNEEAWGRSAGAGDDADVVVTRR